MHVSANNKRMWYVRAFFYLLLNELCKIGGVKSGSSLETDFFVTESSNSNLPKALNALKAVYFRGTQILSSFRV